MYILQNLLGFARSHLILYFSMRTDINLMLGYYKHVLNLPINFFETRKTGEVLSRFMDASKIRDAIASAAVTSLIDNSWEYNSLYTKQFIIFYNTINSTSLHSISIFFSKTI